MLAQNFKTPKQLRITPEKFDALYGVMRMFEQKEIKESEFDMNFESKEESRNYNQYHNRNCRSAMCISGWCMALYPKANLRWEKCIKPLSTMFLDMEINTTEKAAIAIRNFLSTGSHKTNG